MSEATAPRAQTGAAPEERYRLGVDDIARFVNDELGLRVSKRQIQWWLEAGRLRSGRIGRRVIASEQNIREDIARAATGEAA